MGRFLQLFFGCHHRPDRSFYFRGKQFPICARCTGELVGMLLGIVQIILYGTLDIRWCILLMIPMTVDGFRQLLTSYESANGRRFVTGILFGIAFDSMLVWFHRGCVYIASLILNIWVQDMDKVNAVMEKLM